MTDATHPSVVLSTSSPIVTKEANINVVVEFTKPVFGFDASSIEVEGGKVARQVHVLSPENLFPVYLIFLFQLPFASTSIFSPTKKKKKWHTDLIRN